MSITIVQVDAFTDRVYAGNPAAVCVLPEPRSERWMQSVAREMNLSETAFLRPGDEAFALRWFTPIREVDLCGHATLASAHVLWEDDHVEPGATIRFDTKSGRLSATLFDGSIAMDFPAEPPAPCPPPALLLDALGVVEPVAVARNRLDYLVLVTSEAELLAMTPDFAALRRLETRGVIVTAASTRQLTDFASRYFAPAFGVDEDPVTGSAHCTLGPFWQARLGRDTLTGFQASARGGTVHVQVVGDRVRLGGQAVTVMRGTLTPSAAADG